MRCIDADKLQKTVKAVITQTVETADTVAEQEFLVDLGNIFIKMIEDIPTEDVEPKVYGRWIYTDNDTEDYKCSVCGGEIDYPPKSMKRCMYCGAINSIKESNKK